MGVILGKRCVSVDEGSGKAGFSNSEGAGDMVG